MLETSARLLRLLSLFQARRYWSGAELSERLEVTARTLRRDVDRLRSLGYPVNSTSGTAGGYQLSSGATLPPLLLDDDEAVAVAVGLRTAASGTVTGIEEASVRALAKLQQVLPSRLRQRVSALHSFILPLANTGPTVDAETLSAIASACRDYQKLRFGYNSRDGVASTREVEPHRLVHTGRRWYLAAWDLGREQLADLPSGPDRIENRRRPAVRATPAARRRFCSLRRLAASRTRRIRIGRGSSCMYLLRRPPNACRQARGRWKPWTTTRVSFAWEPVRWTLFPCTWG